MHVYTPEEMIHHDSDLLSAFFVQISDWLDNFDTPPELDLRFSIDEDGLLRLNGIALCPSKLVDTAFSLVCDNDLFLLKTTSGLVIEIYIEWPFEGKPFISLISKREDIYVHK